MKANGLYCVGIESYGFQSYQQQEGESSNEEKSFKKDVMRSDYGIFSYSGYSGICRTGGTASNGGTAEPDDGTGEDAPEIVPYFNMEGHIHRQLEYVAANISMTAEQKAIMVLPHKTRIRLRPLKIREGFMQEKIVTALPTISLI